MNSSEEKQNKVSFSMKKREISQVFQLGATRRGFKISVYGSKVNKI